MITQIAITMAQWLITRTLPVVKGYPAMRFALKEATDVIFLLTAEARVGQLTKRMNLAMAKEIREMCAALIEVVENRPTVD